MPQKPLHSAKNDTGDFGRFKDFMRKLVAVPHSEIKSKLDSEKQERKRRMNPSGVRVSRAKG